MIVCFVTTIYRHLPYFTCLAPQAGLAGFAPSLAEGRAAGELERGSQENRCPSCSEDTMLPATASRLLVKSVSRGSLRHRARPGRSHWRSTDRWRCGNEPGLACEHLD